MNYSEKLKDPRWQRRRLEKMSASEWKCEICGDGKEELHVHHPYYDSEKEPWEYSDINLQCLCSTCHTLSHLDRKKVDWFSVRQFDGVVWPSSSEFLMSFQYFAWIRNWEDRARMMALSWIERRRKSFWFPEI